MLTVISESFGALKMVCNSKTAGRRAKRGEIWVLGVLVNHIVGTLDLVVLKVILGLFGAIVSKWPVTRKRLAV